MATRASSKKDSSPKSAPKADQPPNKTAPPTAATDLISPVKKRPPMETRQTSRSAVPPISKASQPAPSPAVAAAAEPVPAAPAPKPETVSLIDDNKSKRSEESSPEPKQRSVLPPISKIRAPTASKPVAPPVPVVRPEPVPAASAEPATASQVPATAGDEKIIH